MDVVLLKREGGIPLPSLLPGLLAATGFPSSLFFFSRRDRILGRVRSSHFRSYMHCPSNDFSPQPASRCPTRCEPRGPLLRTDTITPVCTNIVI